MSSGIYPMLNCGYPTNASYYEAYCERDWFFLDRPSVARTVGEFITAPLNFVPGTEYWYSNMNFVLATYLVEKYAGVPFAEYVRRNISEPIGLRATTFDAFNGQLGGLDPKRTTAYYKFYDETTGARLAVGPVHEELTPGSTSGAGGMLSTTADVEHLWRVLFDPDTGGRPLFRNRSSQRALLAPWILMVRNGTLDGVTRLDEYFCQGIVILCAVGDDACQRPRYIAYSGGTLASHTSNVLAVVPDTGRPGKMVQVWSSSVQSLTTPEVLAETKAAQLGVASDIATASAVDLPQSLAWTLLAADIYPSSSGGASSDKSSTKHHHRSSWGLGLLLGVALLVGLVSGVSVATVGRHYWLRRVQTSTIGGTDASRPLVQIGHDDASDDSLAA